MQVGRISVHTLTQQDIEKRRDCWWVAHGILLTNHTHTCSVHSRRLDLRSIPLMVFIVRPSGTTTIFDCANLLIIRATSSYVPRKVTNHLRGCWFSDNSDISLASVSRAGYIL